MRPQDIRNRIKHEPFRPIRVFPSDGKAYDMRHPEMMMVGRTELVIGVGTGNTEVFDRFAYGDPIHVVRIEP